MTTTTCYSYIDSPLGRMFVQGDGELVTGLFMPKHEGCDGTDSAWRRSDASFAAVREQLAEYFAGERQTFDVPLKLAGAHFAAHWRELVRIPFGTTITYGELARRLGRPTASGRRPRQQPQSDLDHRAVPPCDRRRWKTHRLRRRHRQEAMAARVGTRGDARCCPSSAV